jgi:putative salt-induced outer membrane protein
MNITRLVMAGITAVTIVAPASHAWAQQASSGPPKGLSGSAGFGLSFTQGNSDTLNINAMVDSIYDPKNKNVMKWTALYLRGKQNHVLSVNRVSATLRDEYTYSGRMYVFGQLDTLHDTFKGIDYLIAPVAGVGYKVLDGMRSQLTADGGVGGVVEQDAGVGARGSAALTASEKLVHQLTETTTLRQAASMLLKANDFADGLYTFQVGIAAKISGRLQLSVDVLDSYKNRPFDPTLKKNDVALVTSVVAKY